MIISSRTPEGESNQCPICGHWVRLEPSIGTRDAPCSRCGNLLWFENQDEKNFLIGRTAIDELEGNFDPDRGAVVGLIEESILRLGEGQFGPLDENQRIELMQQSSKFDKIETLDLLFELNSWDELILRLKSVSE
jgi:hypothetical protein